ncbi:MAG: acetate--CoA ligase [Chloroflexi bacterium]|nr:acetate--CoA ligase [Chloroflexota bacterium]
MVELMNPSVERWLKYAADEPDKFWAEAAEKIPWFRKWDEVFDWQPPTFSWFKGGQTNLAYNCIDHHVANGRGDHTALIYANERGERQTFTYAEMKSGIEQISAALRGLGMEKGDRLTIYMPVCPESIMLMLATVRIGAIHSVVFAGFGAGALSDRIRASGSKLVLTADITYRKGGEVQLKGIVDTAMEKVSDVVEHLIVLNRSEQATPPAGEHEMDWVEFLKRGEGQDVSHAVMESNEPAYILATSGTTAKPKLAVHKHGGYQVYIHSMGRWCFGLNADDVWWATSDIGWIVGHSYMVYAPLLMGCTTIAFEGSIDYPGPETFWELIEEYQVSGMFTSPTGVRLMKRYGDEPARKSDLSSLQRIVSAGEVLNAPAWEWLQKDIFEDKIPVIDHMWQTETAGPVFGNPYGIELLSIKPGSAGIPMAGIEYDVVTPEGDALEQGEKGIMVFKRPFPGLISTLWGEPERYESDYWKVIPDVYYTGDAAHVDEDGYIWFAGRADEVIKIAAHRIGTVEVETAFMKHAAVAEAGVIGRPDDLRGEVISAFIALNQGFEPTESLQKELLTTVREELGPVAVIGEINFVNSLPKTRSGKIMRRVFKAIVLGKDPGDITTIEEAGSVEEARLAWQAMKVELENK